MIRAYKTELNPTPSQKEKLELFVGAVRFVWNNALQQRIHLWEQHRASISDFDQMKELTEAKSEFLFLKDVPSSALQATIQNLGRAYNSFFRRVKEGKSGASKNSFGFPKFKNKKSPQGFKFFTKVLVREGSISLPKLGFVKFYEKGYFPVGNIAIKSGAVTKRNNRWFVSITVEIPDDINFDTPIIKDEHDVVGIDLGLKDFLVCSDGMRVSNPKFLEKRNKTRRRIQRSISRKQLGGANRKKAIRRLSNLYMDIGFARKDFINKITTQLTKTKSVIVIEDLNVHGMSQGMFSRQISDVLWGEFRRQLEYKGKWYGCKIIVVPRYFPSSKKCSNCGEINKNLTLKDRHWTCPACFTVHDRDLNASINLKQWYRESLENQLLQSKEAKASEGMEITDHLRVSGCYSAQEELYTDGDTFGKKHNRFLRI